MVNIRVAAARDVGWMQRMALQSAWERLSPEERQTARPEAIMAGVHSALTTAMANPPAGLMLSADLQGVPVGFLLGSVAPDSTTGEPQGLVLELYVLPALRRKGAGKALQQAAEQYFRRLGLRKVKMWTGLHNGPAIQMAVDAGFKHEGLIHEKAW